MPLIGKLPIHPIQHEGKEWIAVRPIYGFFGLYTPQKSSVDRHVTTELLYARTRTGYRKQICIRRTDLLKWLMSLEEQKMRRNAITYREIIQQLSSS